MRQDGFYWIRPSAGDPWEPASWRVEFQDWWLIGSDESFYDRDLAEIGETLRLPLG